DDYGKWEKINQAEDGLNEQRNGMHHKPWYATRFKNIGEVVNYWKNNYDTLKQHSENFSDTFFSTSLAPEVIEAIAANLTILKSPTVLRQSDGRLWGWDGCSDNSVCCAAS